MFGNSHSLGLQIAQRRSVISIYSGAQSRYHLYTWSPIGIMLGAIGSTLGSLETCAVARACGARKNPPTLRQHRKTAAMAKAADYTS